MAIEYHIKCCGCRRVKTAQGWVDAHRVSELASAENSFSHGYCPDCYEKALTAFRMRAPEAALGAVG